MLCWVTWTPSLNSLWRTKFPPVFDMCSGRLSLSLSITRHKCPCLRRQIGKEKQIFRMLQKYSMTPGTLSETAPALKLLFVQGTSRANRSSNSRAKINCFTNVFAPTFPMLCFCHRQATVFEHRSSGSVPMLLSSSAHSSQALIQATLSLLQLSMQLHF